MEVYLSMDKERLDKKPKEGLAIAEVKRRTAIGWQKIGICEAADLIGEKGHAVIPGHMEGGIKAKNCTAMQVFMLDFDCGVSFREIRSRCEEAGIPISFAYHTYSSSKEEERFRVAFVHTTLIEDSYIIKVVLFMLYKIFPECDSACKNIDRLFFGGKKLIYLDEDAHFALVQLLHPFFNALNEGENLNRNFRKFCSKMEILMINNRPAMGDVSFFQDFLKNDGNRDSANIHIIRESGFPSFCIIQGSELHQSIRRRQEKRKLGVKETSNCQLLNDFNSGVELSHNERFLILTNLLQISGGKKHFFEIMDECYEQETTKKWEEDVLYMKGYGPQGCSEEVCPYYGDCENMGNIVNTLAEDRKVYRKEEKLYSIQEAREKLRENMDKAYHASGNGMHLIMAQAGAGKTTLYIRLIKDHPDGRFIVAVPTTRLKEEVYIRLLREGIPVKEIFMTKNIRGNGLIPEEIQESVSQAHARGEHELPKKIIQEYYEEIRNDLNKRDIAEECRKWLEGMSALKEERVIVTTHAYFVNMPEKSLQGYTVIIDEDILQLYLLKQMAAVSVDSLQLLAGKGIPLYSEIAGKMLQAAEGSYQKIPGRIRAEPLTSRELEELECSIENNINDIAYAEAFVKENNRQTGKPEIIYFCPKRLPAAKYIVCSATLNETIYRKYFGRAMPVYGYPYIKAKYKGRVIQHTYHSLGRRDLKEKRQVFFYAKKSAGNDQVEIITFKEEACTKEVRGNNASGIHFGNSTGINELAGKELVIIGTPFSIPESYKLVACWLGADVNREIDKGPKVRRVDYRNANFLLTTYSEPLLREIQFYSLESELEQCIGRARLLEHDCCVHVFSCFPCDQAEIHTGNYLWKHRNRDRRNYFDKV